MSKINNSEKTLIVQDLMFGYARQEPILQNISFTIHSGERVALMGATGAGKSTLLENLIGLKLPKSGQILINGISLESKNLSEIRLQVGFAFQNPDDQLFMPTILEDVMFGLRNQGMPLIEEKSPIGFIAIRVNLL